MLGYLFGQPQRSFFATELIGLAGGGSGAVQREVARLVDSGLVTIGRIGTQKHYQANPKAPVYAEPREMESVAYGATRSRRALGSLNDFMFHLDVLARERPHMTFEGMSAHLAGIPCKPIGYQFPWEAALHLLGEGAGMRGRVH